jgi:hypothetical protein
MKCRSSPRCTVVFRVRSHHHHISRLLQDQWREIPHFVVPRVTQRLAHPLVSMERNATHRSNTVCSAFMSTHNWAPLRPRSQVGTATSAEAGTEWYFICLMKYNPFIEKSPTSYGPKCTKGQCKQDQ